MILTLFAALFLTLAAPAVAEPYLFVGTGIASAKTTTVPETSGSSFMPFSIGGGYRFTPHFSAEASIFDVSKMVATSRQGTTLTQNTWSAYGVQLSVIGTLPVTQSLSLLEHGEEDLPSQEDIPYRPLLETLPCTGSFLHEVLSAFYALSS